MNDYKSLDLDKVKNIIASYSDNDFVKEYILNENIDFNPLIINRKLNETKEFLKYLTDGYTISFDEIINPTLIINKACKGTVLSPFEIVSFLSFHNHVKRIKKTISSSCELTLIKEYSDSFTLDNNLEQLINDCLDNNGNVKSSASNELLSISNEYDDISIKITSYCNNFIKENSDYLQEKSVYERNNRLVLLIKNSYKNKYNGYDYGESGSGQASYIEPDVLVSLNNKKNEIEIKKQNEINKILKALSEYISSISSQYLNNFDILLNINVVYTKAYYGYANAGVIASVGDHIFLKDVRHPLIDKDIVVSNTYTLNNDVKGIIISGSNTGGKTISLKVIGLSLCMSYLGIPILADEVIVPIFDNILVDIDNNQSIKDSLSTFSSHISTINNIVISATNNSLVLIDELISGTDPKYAEALSLSIIDRILNIGSKLIVTTHYDSIKKYGLNRKDILLSSVEFDEKLLKPTYRYIENSIGSSNAISIASRYLNDSYIINKALDIIENNKTTEEKLLSELSNKIQETDKLKKELESKNIELTNKTNEYNKKLDEFNSQIEIKKNELVKAFSDELNSLKNELKNKIKNLNSAIETKEYIKKIDRIQATNIAKNTREFKVGDRVRVNNIEKLGIIDSMNGINCLVNINGMNINTTIDSLTYIPGNPTVKKEYHERKFVSTSSEIVLVGERVEEAIRQLDDYFDKVLLSNLKKVKIIHGIGTLTLKDAIWDYLSKLNYVNKYYSADYYDGGLATTIVELK